ncbi:hypothetical protein G6011_08046 [Alternaria panax]|uniref:Ankyrin n=1 Tax=Alternaria panax TaxID=48097 RepID=A0AAD4I4Y9_9PLEO|nr:hypothetical protein G6011_08046 [Alternaria panax]
MSYRGFSPLTRAIKDGDKDTVKWLIDAGADASPEDRSPAYRSGLPNGFMDVPEQTPLMVAASTRHKDIVELLLSTGKAETNARDDRGWTALRATIPYSQDEIMELLLRSGDIDIEARDNNGSTALIQAASTGSPSAAELLLGIGKADVNAKDNAMSTPLIVAVGAGQARLVELLLATGKVELN